MIPRLVLGGLSLILCIVLMLAYGREIGQQRELQLRNMLNASLLIASFWQVETCENDYIRVKKFDVSIRLKHALPACAPGVRVSFRSVREDDGVWRAVDFHTHGTMRWKWLVSVLAVLLCLGMLCRSWSFSLSQFGFVPRVSEDA